MTTPKPPIIKPPRKLEKSPLTGKPFDPVHGEPCHAIEYSWRVDDYLLTDQYFIEKGEYRELSGGVWVCGRPPGHPGNDARCGKTVDEGEGKKTRRDCYNGHSS